MASDFVETAAEIFDRAVDKGWDKVPDKYFRGDTYAIGKQNSKSQKTRSSSTRDSKPSRRSRAAVGGAAGAGAAGYSGEEDGHRRRRSEDYERGRRGDDDKNDRYGDQYEDPHGYPHQDLQTQSQRAAYSQGDPRFPDSAQLLNPPYNRYAQSSESRSMGDNYYPPQPQSGQQGGSSGYHRYNPADYQPRDYSPAGATQGDRYPTSSRLGDQVDPYKRPQSQGGRDNPQCLPYSDEEDEDSHRGRDKSDKHRNKHRDESPESRNPVVRNVHKHLDSTGEGLAYGAVGALAGGFIGHKFGKHPLATVAGAVIGGLGANAFEAREHKSKEEQHQREKKSKMVISGRSRSEGPSDSRGRGQYSDDDDYDSEEEYRRQKAERKSQRASNRRDGDY